MKAQELRIGNLLSVGADKTTIVTDILTKDFEGWSFLCYGYTESRVSPIPLTEEWLLKFGFSCHKNGFYFKDDWFRVYWEDDILFYCWAENNMPEVKLEYVHQLQNLYFTLTGEELTIKNISI